MMKSQASNSILCLLSLSLALFFGCSQTDQKLTKGETETDPVSEEAKTQKTTDLATDQVQTARWTWEIHSQKGFR